MKIEGRWRKLHLLSHHALLLKFTTEIAAGKGLLYEEPLKIYNSHSCYKNDLSVQSEAEFMTTNLKSAESVYLTSVYISTHWQNSCSRVAVMKLLNIFTGQYGSLLDRNAAHPTMDIDYNFRVIL